MAAGTTHRNRTTGRAASARSAPDVPSFDDLPESSHGALDVYGHLHESAGLWVAGWIPRPFDLSAGEAVRASLQVGDGVRDAAATVVFYERPDLDHGRVGVLLHAPASRRAVDTLRSLTLCLDGAVYGLRVTLSSARRDDRALHEIVRPALVFQAIGGPARDRLLNGTARLGFVGEDTLAGVAGRVALDIDEMLPVPGGGALLKGWLLAARPEETAVRLRCGARAVPLDLSDSIPMAPPDVLAALGAAYPEATADCGFVAFLADALEADETPYLEVDLGGAGMAYKPLRPATRAPLAAIRSVLEGLDLTHRDVDFAFDRVLGPAVQALNAARLARPARVEAVQYGAAPTAPTVSLVIPLYGRIDYLEYQIALFSADPASARWDIVYVLDDPPQRHALRTLAESVVARFCLPFRVLYSDSNRGFAPASNLGLDAARADYVAFVNSDVFPVGVGGLDRLVAHLRRDPRLGAVGPRLLYADGSVQHEGCVTRTRAEYGGWTFIDHVNKGRRPAPATDLLPVDLLTAACVVMRRAVAVQMQGFDEGYVIGDFEDADLCRRLTEKRLRCAVDPLAVCHHLERQSQSRLDGHWRMNLTLYNAWRFQRRWVRPAGADR